MQYASFGPLVIFFKFFFVPVLTEFLIIPQTTCSMNEKVAGSKGEGQERCQGQGFDVVIFFISFSLY